MHKTKKFTHDSNQSNFSWFMIMDNRCASS